MRLNKYDIRYDTSILSWDEGLPLGNGKLGALIYGNGPLRVAIDRVDLWDNRPNPKIFSSEYNYQTLLRLSLSEKEEDWKKREEIFEGFGKLAYPTNITAGRLEIDFGKQTDNIRSKVDIEKAIAEVDIEHGFAKLVSFMHATRFIGVMRVYGRFDFTIHIPEYISGDENGCCYVKSDPYAPAVNRCLAYPRAEIVSDGEFTYYQQKTHTDYEYGIVVLKKESGMGYSDVYYTVVTNKDDGEYITFAKKQLQEISSVGFETLKQEHIAWWKAYWKKSEICINDFLLEKTYYRSWYLFGSCSRKGFAPMSLQGVWIADNDGIPPWKGDYHYDTNVQLSYQSYLKANHLPEGEVLVDYLWDLREKFQQFAQDFFGVKGLLLPGTTSLDGNAMGGWPQYSLSPTMSIWAAQSFDEYYLYTGNKKFLKERAYPYFKEIGKAIKGLLKEKDGKLYLPLSTSPEIFDNTKKAYLNRSNFDQALLIYLFKTLESYAKILGKNKETLRYEKILNKLDGIALEGRHVLLDASQPPFTSHRHFSHLMCLYPLHLINYDTEEHKRIYDGSLWDIELLGTGLWVGYSYAMCAQICAMAQRGNAAYERLRQFSYAYVAENGFHLNGDFKGYGYSVIGYRPFTLEASFAYCDALHEMLLQDHQGYIHLFPAIPQEWEKREVKFKTLRSRNGVLVSASCKKGKTNQASFSVKKKTEILLKNTFGTEKLLLEKGGKSQVVETDGNNCFRLTLQRGTTVLKVEN